MQLNSRMKDLTGLTFGRLTAIRPLRQEKRQMIWEFSCSCGQLHEAAGYTVVRQHKLATNPEAPSCGCLNKETTSALRLKHKISNHPLF